MSLQARFQLVSSGRLVFQASTQGPDLLDPDKTQTELIAMLQYLTKTFYLELTAVKTDHGNDSCLGLHGHYYGWAVDCWPLASATPGDYLDAGSEAFRAFLAAIPQGPFYHQTGLGGSADTPENHAAAGSGAFSDNGADHVHIGTC